MLSELNPKNEEQSLRTQEQSVLRASAFSRHSEVSSRIHVRVRI